MKERRPAASWALGTRTTSVFLLAVLLNPLLADDNCHLTLAVQNNPISVPSNTTTYCQPAKGCTFIEEYQDCVRDNETPQCVYYSAANKECLLCYTSTEGSPWLKPSSAPTSVKDSLKVPAGAKLCESVPP